MYYPAAPDAWITPEEYGTMSLVEVMQEALSWRVTASPCTHSWRPTCAMVPHCLDSGRAVQPSSPRRAHA